MSFLSKLKSPLKRKHLPALFQSNGDKEDDSYTASHTRNLTIYHIDPDNEGTISIRATDDELGDDVLQRVCDDYNVSNYKEYFGLKYTYNDQKSKQEVFWVDPQKPIGKQLKHSNNVLTFRVKFFPSAPYKIDCDIVRHFMFMQLRTYLQKGQLQVSQQEEYVLASYFLQALFGDDEQKAIEYTTRSPMLLRKSKNVDESIIEYYKKLRGKPNDEAKSVFLQKVSLLDTYGAEIMILRNKQGVAVNFGASHKGIITCLSDAASSPRVDVYPWSQIGEITFHGRSLHIHAYLPDKNNPEIIKKQTMIFKCDTERCCKHLWKLVLDQKSFFNFESSVDVPRVRSTRSLFSRGTKFRYSGRCEKEIIRSQSLLNRSINSTPKSLHYSYESGILNGSTNTDSGLSDNYENTNRVEDITMDETNLNMAKSAVVDGSVENLHKEEPKATSTPSVLIEAVFDKNEHPSGYFVSQVSSIAEVEENEEKTNELITRNLELEKEPEEEDKEFKEAAGTGLTPSVSETSLQTAISEDNVISEADKVGRIPDRQLAINKLNEAGLILKNDLMHKFSESNYMFTVAFVILTLLIVFVFGGLNDINCVLFALGSFFSSIYNLFSGTKK